MVTKILTLPGMVHSMIKTAPSTGPIWQTIANEIFHDFPLSATSHLSATSTLSVFANCLQLFQMSDLENSTQKVVQIFIFFLRHIRKNTDQSKASNMSWHPILGYCISTNEAQPDSLALEAIQDWLFKSLKFFELILKQRGLEAFKIQAPIRPLAKNF